MSKINYWQKWLSRVSILFNEANQLTRKLIMRNAVKYVCSIMYQNITNVTFIEKCMVSRHPNCFTDGNNLYHIYVHLAKVKT
jgi:hypothetical protein